MKMEIEYDRIRKDAMSFVAAADDAKVEIKEAETSREAGSNRIIDVFCKDYYIRIYPEIGHFEVLAYGD